MQSSGSEFEGQPLREVFSNGEDPFLHARRPWRRGLFRIGFASTAAFLLLAIGAVDHRWRRAGGRSQQSLRRTSRNVEEKLVSLASGAQPQPARKRPHIIFLLIDDLGFNDFTDSPDLAQSWPNLKKIAGKSVYINTTMTEAWCSPSRAALLSGRYWHLLSRNDFSSKDETTIAQRLNSVGYMSYAVGKWHVGWRTWAWTPAGRGFHRYLGNLENPQDHYTHCSRGHEDGWMYYDQTYIESYPFLNETSSPQKPLWDVAEGTAGQYDTTVYAKAVDVFLRQHKEKFPDKPFFLYYAMYADHHPYQASDRWMGDCKDVLAEGRRYMCGMQVAADSAVLNLTERLRTTFPGDDYVIILTGDNGGMIGKGKKTEGWGDNVPLRGAKFSSWEGGVHSQALVWGEHPDLKASSMLGKTYMGGFMHLVDWHATMAELGGAPLDGGFFPASGKSVWKAILNNEPSPRNQILIRSAPDHLQYFRTGDWVLMTLAANASQEKQLMAPPVYPIPMHEYEDTLADFLLYKSRHKGVEVTLPALFNIWDDVSMESPVTHADRIQTTIQEMKEWREKSGYPSSHSDDTCASATCAAEREAAKDRVTKIVGAGIRGRGNCSARAFYPYWDVPTCSCSD